jgi:hypothetical protein
MLEYNYYKNYIIFKLHYFYTKGKILHSFIIL